jgi:hypothetical protein
MGVDRCHRGNIIHPHEDVTEGKLQETSGQQRFTLVLLKSESQEESLC